MIRRTKQQSQVVRRWRYPNPSQLLVISYVFQSHKGDSAVMCQWESRRSHIGTVILTRDDSAVDQVVSGWVVEIVDTELISVQNKAVILVAGVLSVPHGMVILSRVDLRMISVCLRVIVDVVSVAALVTMFYLQTRRTPEGLKGAELD